MTAHDSEPVQEGPVIRDRRRIDPETFEARQAQPAPGGPGQPAAPDAPAASAPDNEEVSSLKTAVAERTADLQRLQAEYVNYKRRVDRDRDLARAAGVESVLRDLLSVLDDLRSARLHEELSPGLRAVAEQIERVAAKHGLELFGEPGDAFNPHIHEALLHAHAEGIDGPTCVEILQPGYRIRDKVIRPARVAVAEPSGAPGVTEPSGARSDAEPFGAASDAVSSGPVDPVDSAVGTDEGASDQPRP
jgi:molecular chaperone GrpE